MGHGGGCWLGLQAGAGPASRLSGVREARGSGTAMAERATAGEESRGAPEAAPAGGRIPPRKEEAGPHLPGAACAARKDPTVLRNSHAAAPIGAAEGSATGRDYFGSHHSSSPLRLPFFFFCHIMRPRCGCVTSGPRSPPRLVTCRGQRGRAR